MMSTKDNIKKTSKHIEDTRIMELALSPMDVTHSTEGVHLASCQVCAAKLEAERELTFALEELKPSQIPTNLSVITRIRFEQALNTRKGENLRISTGILLTTVAVILSLALTGIIDTVDDLMFATGALFTFASASLDVALSTPLFSLFVIITTGIAALLLVLILTGLVRESSAQLKYSRAPSVPEREIKKHGKERP